MRPYLLLLSPRLRSLLNRFKGREEGAGLKLLLMSLVAVGFWILVFFAFFKVLGYFQAAEGFGHILARKLMNMLWLTFFSVLIFSNVITALSTFFLSKDLETIHASPISQETLFWARLTDTLIDSSWMLFFFGLPVFLAYGIVYQAGILYYLKLAAVTAPFLVLATSLAVPLTLVLVSIFPARRTKDILLLLGILLVIILYLLFRFMRPERLVNPEAFRTIISYFAALETPGSPYLPSHWATEALWPSLNKGIHAEAGFFLLFLWSSAAAASVAASWIASLLYGYGFSKAQEGARRSGLAWTPVDLLIKMAGRPFDPASRVLIAKDIRTFFRDNTQWSQILLLLALIVIYLYNFSVLDFQKYPFKTFYLQNVISFLNIGLAAFVTASLGVRFVFPAVSQEGFAFWIIRSSPLSLKRFLWTKFWVYSPPLMAVALVLIVVSNYLLEVSPFMMILSTATMFFLVLGLVGLGVGLGAVYPRFEAENIAAVATGFGGMMFMIFSAIYVAVVIALEAWPVSVVLRAGFYGRPVSGWQMVLMAFCFVGVIGVNLAAVLAPMRLGRLRLLDREAG
ncbi:MAG: hypothetical protein AB1641_30275 [Thermodesulfobacteriota bacterium]